MSEQGKDSLDIQLELTFLRVNQRIIALEEKLGERDAT